MSEGTRKIGERLKLLDSLIDEAREIVNYTNRDAKDFTRKIKSQILVEKISKLKKSGEDA